MLSGKIYCATSPSNKKYYGYTIKKIEQRKLEHIKDALVNKSKKLFSVVLRKYGAENFRWDVIEEYYRNTKLELKAILSEREMYWILKDQTYLPEFGYNMTMGGDGVLGYKFTLEQYKKVCEFNKKLTDAQKNIPRTVETKNKMSLAKKGKSYEEIYGEEKAKEMKEKRSTQLVSDESRKKRGGNRKDKTYAEIYGEEKAQKMLKRKREMYSRKLVRESLDI